MARTTFALVLALSLFVNVFCVPYTYSYRPERDLDDNEVSLKETQKSATGSSTTQDDDDFDEDFDEPLQTSATTGGSSGIFSLLRLATAFLPNASGSSGSGSSGGANPANVILGNLIRDTLIGFPPFFPFALRRNDIKDNVIETDEIKTKEQTPLFQRQETDENSQEESNSETEESSHASESSDNSSSSVPDPSEDTAAEESVENNGSSDNDKQDSVSVTNDSNSDYDSDEPPGGDGMGGGILGLLAGLSGGDGDSDLGTLLATIGGIVANLSGDGIDLNSLIASGIGLFAGLLSEGEENPGSIVASYLLTSLDTITGGGAQNNGAFFGRFISKLVKGTSAAGDPDASSEEGDDKPEMADSAGFLLSLITSLLGDMSKGSSGGSSAR